jgi:hypothetical protein
MSTTIKQGRTIMEPVLIESCEMQEQRTPAQLEKRIRKLRWIGLVDEAECLQMELSRSAHAGSVLTMPRETD